LDSWVFGGMFGEDLIEDGEEVWVFGERVGRRR
jgi:hypothetical protein